MWCTSLFEADAFIPHMYRYKCPRYLILLVDMFTEKVYIISLILCDLIKEIYLSSGSMHWQNT